MYTFPISETELEQKINELGVADSSRMSIRETGRLANMLEQMTNEKFVRLEMGVPGLQPPQIALEAERDAANKGLCALYPPVDGVAELKQAASRFAKSFINVDVPAKNCLATTGSMQACFASFMVANRTDKNKGKTLFIDPGFPVNKSQLKVLGMKYETFDVYDYRGEKLEAKLESYLKKGDISTILYSSPNNPSWINFTEDELKTIGTLATKYDVIVMEDLAYFGMDFRRDISTPNQAPYNPTVAKYTDNWILLLSASKSFSYAGQRIAVMMISPAIFDRNYPDLKEYFGNANFGHAMIFDALYTLSTGTTHTPQYGFAAMLNACCDGKYNFVEPIKEYARRAEKLKKAFFENGFIAVYDKDGNEPVADGFYFTVTYPGMDCGKLVKSLLRFGISAVGLNICGSCHDGIRVCVSQLSDNVFENAKQRIKAFNEYFSK
ncbi:MAG: pyridoxal phosphate-dependent aminotransferase [Bacteroidales bacterium]|nr:pyridoxal phosphate-dependent aminotransferase [Bacteroidales bacterium]